jgi:hypothetical protein
MMGGDSGGQHVMYAAIEQYFDRARPIAGDDISSCGGRGCNGAGRRDTRPKSSFAAATREFPRASGIGT